MKKRLCCIGLGLALMLLAACTDSGGTTSGEAPVGGTAEEIVAYYNNAANSVKAADSITVQKSSKIAQGENEPMEESEEGSFVNGVSTQYAARKLNDFLPVSGQDYVSKLAASAVDSAVCEAEGDGWVIRITLSDETAGAGADASAYASCMDIGGNSPGGTPGEMPSDFSRPDGEMPSMPEGASMPEGEPPSMPEGFSMPDGEMPSRPDGAGMPEGEMPSMPEGFSMPEGESPPVGFISGTYQDGEIEAHINGDGQLVSLRLSYAFAQDAEGETMTSEQEFQFTWA